MHIPNTPMGRVIREEREARLWWTDGYHEGYIGKPASDPYNERYMAGWREGRRDGRRERDKR